MSPFVVKAGRTTCTTCGARIDNTTAAKVEHLTTPSAAAARCKAAKTKAAS